MPLRVQCPDCSARLTAPDSSAGQEIECPKCGSLLALPAAEPEADEPAPARRKARPRDDQDETPRKKKRPKPAAKASKTPLLIGAGVVVALVGVGLAILLGGKKDKPTAGGGGVDGGSGGGTTPQAAANYKVLSPRTRFKVNIPSAGPNVPAGYTPSFDTFLLSPDGSRVLTSFLVARRPVEVWDTRGDAKQLFTDTVQSVSPVLSPDGTWFEVKRGDKREALSLDTGKPMPGKLSLGGEQFRTYLAGPDRVISLDNGGGTDSPFYLREFTISNGVRATQAVKVYDTYHVQHSKPVKGGRELFLIGQKNTDRIRVWDIDGRKVAREFALAPPLQTAQPVISNTDFAVSEDGKLIALRRVATVRFDPIEIFDETGARVGQVPEHVIGMWAEFVPGRPLYVAPVLIVPPNLTSVRTVFQEQDIVAFDVRQNKFVAAFRAHTDQVLRLAVSANGKVMATADKSGTVCVWDLDQAN